VTEPFVVCNIQSRRCLKNQMFDLAPTVAKRGLADGLQ